MATCSSLAHLFDGHDLSQQQTREVFGEVMSGNATPAQIGALLAALRVKGETPAEIAGAAEAQLRRLRQEHGDRRLGGDARDHPYADLVWVEVTFSFGARAHFYHE